MATNNNVGSLDLDDLYAPPLVLTFREKDHTIPGNVFTMETVMSIQHAMDHGRLAVANGDEDKAAAFHQELVDLVEGVLEHAKPKLTLGPLPPAALAEIAMTVIRHAYGAQVPDEDADDDAVPPTRPNRQTRRAKPRTSPTRR